MPTLIQIIALSCLSCLIMLIAEKNNFREDARHYFEKLVIAHPENRIYLLIVKMLECEFCSMFWLNTALAILFALLRLDNSWLIAGLISTPISRKLL